MELPSKPEMEKAFLQKDSSFDGVFFTAVRTTGIFCRPTCPARKPLPQNLEFYATAREALFAGFRPCKRCRPLHVSGGQPKWIEELLNQTETDPQFRFKDGELRKRGLDPATVRRYFRKNFGMTFHSYCRGMRMSQAFEKIRNGKKLDDVAFDHGFESLSGFREAFTRIFGEAPGRSRTKDCITVAWIESPLGPLIAGATDDGICLLEFTDRRMLETQFMALQKHFGIPVVPGQHKWLTQLKKELSEYFEKSRTEFEVPLHFPGSPFQKKTWEALRKIPYGKTCSYEELANKTGSPKAQRAVGHANGQNRIAIVIPCHRVVNKDGQLGGYGGGLWRKKFLLDLEQTTTVETNITGPA